MSNVARVAGQAANTLVKPLNVEDVFSTYLYEGNGSTQTITNGIDLDGEGGLVWIKHRQEVYPNMLYDTERGALYDLNSDATAASALIANSLTSFNSDGFSVGSYSRVNAGATNKDMASWTFRKAPKFFDVVTYTGNGSNQYISHNLGSIPGCIIVKRTDAAGEWAVYHRGVDATAPEDYFLNLNNTTGRADSIAYWYDTPPTDSNFRIAGNSGVNASGGTYVAYLFAHNDGDAEFGPTGDQDVIKCGSFTTDGSGNFDVNLGFEPQFFLTKRADATQNWYIWDTMRGWTVSGTANGLVPNASSAELDYFGGTDYFHPTANGIEGTGNFFGTNADVIYIAIRRGPMAVPESATDVFAVDNGDGSSVPAWSSGFPVDMALERSTSTDDMRNAARLISGKYLITNSTAAEVSNSARVFDYMDGWLSISRSTSNYSWMWKRAPNFFDVVAYTGDGTTSRDIAHNLGVVPELQFIKRRTTSGEWWASATPAGAGKVLYLNRTNAAFSYTAFGTATATTFQTETVANNDTNFSGAGYIWFGFASLDGVSKVGSYTGNGSTQTIDCGFSAGARFVLIKCSNDTGDWNIFDTERGIVAGNDSRLTLNTTDPELTSYDAIDPSSSGFIVNTAISDINDSGQTYIFYAIA